MIPEQVSWQWWYYLSKPAQNDDTWASQLTLADDELALLTSSMPLSFSLELAPFSWRSASLSLWLADWTVPPDSVAVFSPRIPTNNVGHTLSPAHSATKMHSRSSHLHEGNVNRAPTEVGLEASKNSVRTVVFWCETDLWRQHLILKAPNTVHPDQQTNHCTFLSRLQPTSFQSLVTLCIALLHESRS